MPVSSHVDILDSPNIILGEMRSRLGEAFNLIGTSGTDALLRIEIEITRMDPLTWLRLQAADEKIYWSDREEKFEVAGIGVADRIEVEAATKLTGAIARVQERLVDAPEELRYFGGARFNVSLPASDEWRSFGTGMFVLPRFEIVSSKDNTTFACNLNSRQDRHDRESVLTMLDRIVFTGDEVSDALVPPVSRKDLPDFEGWSRMLCKATDAFSSGAYQKIVLARRSVLKYDQPVPALGVLAALKEQAAGCFHFCFQTDKENAFIGASPERLYYRNGVDLECEALAGTRRRGVDAVEDARLGQELLESEKDMREHRYVLDGLQESLDALVASEVPQERTKVTLRKLARVQHLLVQFGLMLRPEVTDSELLEGLHPTAAVGGYPRDAIADEINRLEPFDRGWYAGPIGWLARDSAEFAVAIRSGLVQGSELSLYAGAGILRGSDVTNEWHELENKLGTFLNAVTR